MKIYLQLSGQIAGPFTREEVLKKINTGEAHIETPARLDTTYEWMPFYQLPRDLSTISRTRLGKLNKKRPGVYIPAVIARYFSYLMFLLILGLLFNGAFKDQVGAILLLFAISIVLVVYCLSHLMDLLKNALEHIENLQSLQFQNLPKSSQELTESSN